MNWVIFSNSNINRYNNYVDANKYSGIWHQTCWLEFQRSSGKIKDGFYFGIEDNGEIILAGLLLIQKSKYGNYGYIPAGFLYIKFDEGIYEFFIKNLSNISKRYNLFFTQIDSITPLDENFEKITFKYKNHSFEKKLPIPRYTNIIPLSSSLDEILKNMKHKGRYNINLAEKKQVEIRIGGVDDIPVFYNILKETTLRDGFNNLNPESYYRNMLAYVKESVMLIANHENDILCANIFTFTKNQALYYYGASSNIKRNLMAPYLVQWEAIKMAKDRNCQYFDFMGIADPNDPDDRLKGVTEFKLKFGGEVLKFQPSYHIIHNSFLYSTYNLFKKIKKHYTKKV